MQINDNEYETQMLDGLLPSFGLNNQKEMIHLADFF